MPGQRTFATGSYALELDGKDAGPLRSVSGGDAFADVVVESTKSYFSKKHVANVKWTPLRLTVGSAIGKPLSDWIADTFNGTFARKTGAVVELDSKGVVKARRAFADAIISEVTFPAWDGASKEAAYLTIELTPEQVTTAKASGKAGPLVKQKQWVTSNFKLEIDGLDATKVSKIEAFTVKQSVAAASVGERRRKEPTSVEFPNLVVTLAASAAKTWSDWFDDFILKGESGDANEKNGTLRFLGPNLKDELGELRFFNLGIFKLASDTTQAKAIKRVVAELYCERMELDLP